MRTYAKLMTSKANLHECIIVIIKSVIIFIQIQIQMIKGAKLASATVPWHWLFFASPRSSAIKICLEIMNIFQKSFDASKWHWLILALIGALEHDPLLCTSLNF